MQVRRSVVDIWTLGQPVNGRDSALDNNLPRVESLQLSLLKGRAQAANGIRDGTYRCTKQWCVMWTGKWSSV